MTEAENDAEVNVPELFKIEQISKLAKWETFFTTASNNWPMRRTRV